eukprot:2188488-Pyramimonas_sp.AAC.4
MRASKTRSHPITRSRFLETHYHRPLPTARVSHHLTPMPHPPPSYEGRSWAPGPLRGRLCIL